MRSSSEWLVWQLADSAFPTGGFAHSGGLEAAWQLGLVGRSTLRRFLVGALEHALSSSLPIASAVHRKPERFDELDRLAEASLANHVANRASRAQGAALLLAASCAFEQEAVRQARVRAKEQLLPQHLAPCFGLVTRALEIEHDDACRLFAFWTLRTLASSAVRLGIVGPLEVQGIQFGIAAVAEELATRCSAREPEQVAQTSPLIELFQAHQDRLYSRLFSS
jgi:urease accessory protein